MRKSPRVRTPKATLSAAERRALVERLRADGARIAERFGLRYSSIEAEDARVRRRYGSCHTNGEIRIRLTHVRTGRPLKYSSMIDTLCHELAHLKYFNHGPRFRDFYEVILDWARRANIYRPTPRGITRGALGDEAGRDAARTAPAAATEPREDSLVPALTASLAASLATQRPGREPQAPQPARTAPPARPARPPWPPRKSKPAPLRQLDLF